MPLPARSVASSTRLACVVSLLLESRLVRLVSWLCFVGVYTVFVNYQACKPITCYVSKKCLPASCSFSSFITHLSSPLCPACLPAAGAVCDLVCLRRAERPGRAHLVLHTGKSSSTPTTSHPSSACSD